MRFFYMYLNNLTCLFYCLLQENKIKTYIFALLLLKYSQINNV